MEKKALKARCFSEPYADGLQGSVHHRAVLFSNAFPNEEGIKYQVMGVLRRINKIISSKDARLVKRLFHRA